MGASVRPVVPPTPDDAEFQAWKARQRPAAAATHDDAEFQAWKTSQPNAVARGLAMAGQAITHPIDTGKAIVSSTADTFKTAGGYLGQRAAELTLPSDVRAMAEADPTRISGRSAALAGAQIATMIAAPAVAGALTRGAATVLPAALSRVAGTVATGAGAGAVFNPSDPGAGAVAGATLAPATELAMKAGGSALRGVRAIGTNVLDKTGTRPAVSTPLIASTADRAADINAAKVPVLASSSLSPVADKPLTPIEMGGTEALRAARALKTASPAAEQVFRDALEPRAANAVDRVIQHGLEATGLATRENGLQIVDDMIAQRAQHGAENYRPIFENYKAPLADPEFAAVAQTPAGQQALKRANVLAANRGESMTSARPAAVAAPDLSGLSPDQRTLYGKLLQLNGGDVEPTIAAMQKLGETVPTVAGQGAVAPTLKQAHYIKLAFDDMLSSAPEPGTGGLGPNNASAIRGLKGRWLAAMDRAAPEYASARKTFADESELLRGAEFGRTLFQTDPSLAEKTMREMPQAAQDVARRTGFDALAERIENGPADVERGTSKPRDQRRMRLLFPDQPSFDQFREGLKQEAMMHTNEQAIFGGSQTADKLADVANMAGVTLPDVARALATGRLRRLVGVAAANTARKLTTGSSEALAAERARLLVAGAGGDATARLSAMDRMTNPPASDPFFGDMTQAFARQARQRAPAVATAGSTTDPSARRRP